MMLGPQSTVRLTLPFARTTFQEKKGCDSVQLEQAELDCNCLSWMFETGEAVGGERQTFRPVRSSPAQPLVVVSNTLAELICVARRSGG